MNRIEQIHKFIDRMPALPITVSKILEITRNPKSTAKDLNDVISVDPVLTGKVLKLINSAYYGIENEVTSIVRAIIMLGLNTIKNLAISTAIMESVKKNQYIALNIDGYWRHSIGVGVTAKRIAANIGINKKYVEEYFIAGLLHDIGKIILNQYFPKLYIEAIKLSDLHHIPLYKLEQKIIHIDHTMVGKLIAKKWSLNPEIESAIIYHHIPKESAEEHKKIVYVINLANIFCIMNDIGFGGDNYKSSFNKEILDYLNLSETALFDILDDISSDIKKAEVFLKLIKED